MSRNDDEKKAREMQKALRLPGRDAHLDEEEMANREAFKVAMKYGGRAAYEALLRKRGFLGITLQEMLEDFDEYQRKNR